DLFAECYGARNDFARKAYLGMINRTPHLWQWVYQWIDHTPGVESGLGLLGKMQGRLAQLLEAEKPDVVVSVYPLYSYLVRRIYPDGKRPFALVTIVTDSITINSVWYRGGSDYFIMPNEDTAAVMRGAGVEEAKLKPLGFPVTHRFFTEAAVRKPPGEGNRRVLYMINSGKTEAPNIVKHLLGVPGVQLTVTVGRDEALRAAVERVAKECGRTVEIYGWTDQMPRLLMESHLLVSKAGGATVQEAIAAKTPMLIMQIVPGQEEGNARLLLGHGCGALTETAEEIAKKTGEAFADGAALWREWERNIARLSKPDAALVIARFLLDLKARE
ncbi:MAG TPA: glycosyltransferase, partial [Chthoniobacteraceae bacterium]|nr:glycosyltransferase [Chthoniobacteraceae bacterium]